jgi:hypothetical protein
MTRSEVLRNTIAMTRPGTEVALDVVHRNGNKDTLRVKLGQLPDEQKVADQAQQLPNGFKVPKGWQCKQTRNGMQCYSNGNQGGGGLDPFAP